MIHSSPITFCISTYNNLPYLKLAIESVRKNSYFKDAPFIIHAENCTDGTNEWLLENRDAYKLTLLIEPETIQVRGIGGGMNVCAEHVETEYIMFLHSDFYVSENWDIECLQEHEKYQAPTWVFSYRVEPDMFGNGQSRPGTIIVPKDIFGAYHDDFDTVAFEGWAKEFTRDNNIKIQKTEGVSGLIKKKDWDRIGGNDPQFSPTSWEDIDLFLRMYNEGYNFVLTTKSLVWHFGARGSHRLEENEGKSSRRQIETEQINQRKFLEKWGGLPKFNNNGLITGINNIKENK
jgi:GT2 family glycosyltransferase